MTLIPATARTVAERTLTDTCTITRVATDDTFTDGALAAGTNDTVYAGACSLSPVSTSNIVDTSGAERLIETRILRLPATAAVVRTGDAVTIGAGAYVIERVATRSSEVLRRVRLVSATDAHLVPR